MVVKHNIEGYDAFKTLIKDLEAKKFNIFVFFEGSLDSNGISWCPDCVEAEPLVEEVVKKLPDTIHLVYVRVGDRQSWKDPKCPFRTDPKMKLKSVPTLLRWNGPQRLEDKDFTNKEVIEMIFEEE